MRTRLFWAVAAMSTLAISPAALAENAADCPNGGEVRFGVEPYDTSAKLVPIYDHIAKAIADKLGCRVTVFVTTTYKAEAVAAFSNAEGKPDNYWASIVVPKGSPIKTVAEIKGHTFAFSDPASTSGHLFPAYGLRKAGVDPDKDITASYAGSHTASFEALYNKKVDAGELNSEQLESATQRGHYNDGDLIFLWKSDPIPTDPISVRGDLPEGFKRRLTEVLQTLDLSSLPEADRKIMGLGGTRFVPQTDDAYDLIRDLVKTLNIDLNKLS